MSLLLPFGARTRRDSLSSTLTLRKILRVKNIVAYEDRAVEMGEALESAKWTECFYQWAKGMVEAWCVPKQSVPGYGLKFGLSRAAAATSVFAFFANRRRVTSNVLGLHATACSTSTS